MTVAAGPYLAACLLLMVAGAAKLHRPAPTQRALAAVARRRRSAPALLVRAGGLAELALGGVALTSEAPTAPALVAFCYLGFATFAVASVAAGGAGGCGCFGEASGSAPLGPLHVVVNISLAGAALAVASGGGLQAPAGERALLSLLAAGVAWATYLVLVPLPRLMAAVRGPRR